MSVSPRQDGRSAGATQWATSVLQIKWINPREMFIKEMYQICTYYYKEYCPSKIR